MKKCCECVFHKSMSSKIPGKKIPGGTGKCLREGGPCEEYIPAGFIGETIERSVVRRDG